MQLTRFKLLVMALVLLFTASLASAASVHKRVVDDNDTIPVKGNTPSFARPELDRGPVDQNMKYERMILVLSQRSGAKDSLTALIAAQHDPTSPLYHQWITPAEFGQRFGISDDDLNDTIAWLQRQ